MKGVVKLYEECDSSIKKNIVKIIDNNLNHFSFYNFIEDNFSRMKEDLYTITVKNLYLLNCLRIF